jgi:hypothetical protein
VSVEKCYFISRGGSWAREKLHTANARLLKSWPLGLLGFLRPKVIEKLVSLAANGACADSTPIIPAGQSTNWCDSRTTALEKRFVSRGIFEIRRENLNFK